jgi:predicted lipoprotein with Yx(FWY)xxD motif
MPLYTWAKDQKPGDKTGDGMANGAWKVAMMKP